MEETRLTLKEHYSAEGDLLMKQWVKNIGKIGNIPPTTPGFVGGAVVAFAATLCLECPTVIPILAPHPARETAYPSPPPLLVAHLSSAICLPSEPFTRRNCQGGCTVI